MNKETETITTLTYAKSVKFGSETLTTSKTTPIVLSNIVNDYTASTSATTTTTTTNTTTTNSTIATTAKIITNEENIPNVRINV